MDKRSLFKGGGVAAVLALLVSFVGDWEGLRTKAYYDAVGVPTICYGETKGVRIGQVRTKDQCDAMLLKSLRVHEAEMLKHLKSSVVLPKKTQIAFVSFVYNVGGVNWKKSSVLREANKGNLEAACANLKKFVYAKGKRLKGLENRRAAEYKLCMDGIKEWKKLSVSPSGSLLSYLHKFGTWLVA